MNEFMMKVFSLTFRTEVVAEIIEVSENEVLVSLLKPKTGIAIL